MEEKNEDVTKSDVFLNAPIPISYILCASRNDTLSFLVLKFIFFIIIIINNMINLIIILKKSMGSAKLFSSFNVGNLQ
jgi:hypothetical protein